MKIVAISDTHDRHDRIKDLPDGDVLVHAGDATSQGLDWEIETFLEWFAAQMHKYKVFVPGNHDFGFEEDPKRYIKMCEDLGIIILNDSGIEIEGVKFWGSPVSPRFFDWAFNVDRGEAIKKHWDLIPEGTNVLITHGPPFGILDYVQNRYNPAGKSVGCEELMGAVVRIKPDVHIFGHIHEGHGEKHVDGTSFYNAAICDGRYVPCNSPHVIEL